MAAFLSKLFKPKWQSKQLPVRLEAIKALDENNAEHQTHLQSIARDDDHLEARSAAIAKITNSQILIDLHRNCGEGALQRSIETRLHQLATHQSLTLFDLIVDPQILSEMIVHSDQPDAFINGLAHIQSAEALLHIATTSKTSRMRQAAAELLESEQQLTELAQTAKAKDKSVYQIAKAKLARIRDEQRQRETQQAAVQRTLSDLEDLSRTDNVQMYDAKLDSLRQKWQHHAQSADDNDRERFQSLYAKCAQRSATQQAKQEEQQAAEQLARAGGDEHAATLLMLEETLTRFQRQPGDTQDIAALDALIKTQETRWLEATRHHEVERSQAKRYQTMMQALRRLLTALRALAEHSTALHAQSSALSEASAGSPIAAAELARPIQKALAAIDWPADLAVPSTIKQAEAALKLAGDLKSAQAEISREVQAQMQEQLQALEQELEERQIKRAAQLLKALQARLPELERREAEKIKPAISLYAKQLAELRAWHSEAACPHQEALCANMERLADTTMEPRAKADKVRAMQKEWKKLGGSGDQALWQRFKAAADRAYEPCQLFFDEQHRLKEQHLQRRMTIIEQLEGYLANADWNNADWPSVDKISRQAKQEWKQAYPVDHKQNKTPQRQFNALIKQIEQKLEEERARNHALKESLIVEAEALAANEDLAVAIEGAKQLQARWKQVGITAHKIDRALWQRFRAHCDAIFGRRDAQRDARKVEWQQHLDDAKALLTSSAETLKSNVDIQQLNELNARLQEGYQQLGKLPQRNSKDVQAQFQRLMGEVSEAKQRQERSARHHAWHNALRAKELCEKLHHAKLNSSASEEEGLLKAGELFFTAGPLQPVELGESMRELWIAVKADSFAKHQRLDLSDAGELCIRAEIAAGIESPETDSERRMQLQVNRLSEGMSSQNQHQSRADELASILQPWLRAIVSGKAADEMDQVTAMQSRIVRCIDAIWPAA